MRINPNPFFGFLFRDPVRLIELLSALNLAAWAMTFLRNPQIVERDAYVVFASLPAAAWSVIFGIVGALQIAATFWAGDWRRGLRFAAMAMAAGCWSVVSLSFFASGVGTTANMNYALLTLSCMASGGFLAWKDS